MTKEPLTKELSKELKMAWAQDWKQPHMVAGLESLKEFSGIDSKEDEAVSGEHALTMAASRYWFKMGQSSILKEIERMGVVPKENKSLPVAESFKATKDFRDNRE